MKHIDITGQRYGMLVALYQIPKDEKGRYRYLCLCDCGNTIEARAERLRRGKIKSCGCLKHAQAVNRIPDRNEAVLRREYSELKKRNKKFSQNGEVISLQQFKDIVNQPCYYCGAVGSKKIQDRIRNRGKTHVCSDKTISINGIDRLDSMKGYIDGNCVSCCKTCNYAKNTLTLDEFKDWVMRVYERICK